MLEFSVLWIQYHCLAIVLMFHLFTCSTFIKLNYFNFSTPRNFYNFPPPFFYHSSFSSNCTCKILLIFWGHLSHIAISFEKTSVGLPNQMWQLLLLNLSCKYISLMSLKSCVLYYTYVHVWLFKIAITLGKRKTLGTLLNSLYRLAECCFLPHYICSCYTNLTCFFIFKFVKVLHKSNDYTNVFHNYMGIYMVKWQFILKFFNFLEMSLRALGINLRVSLKPRKLNTFC